MQQILKRLELIKTSISIEDEEIIELQIIKLSKIDIDNDVKNILKKLDNKDYGTVVIDIENYIKKYTGIIVYEDKELQGLKLELKALEKKLQKLSENKLEYQKNIEEFNIFYNIYLGELIKKVLNLRKEILHKETFKKKKRFENLKSEYEELKEELGEKEGELNQKRKEAKEAKDDLENDETYKKYEETKRDYEDFKEEYEETLKESENCCELNEDEKKELKTIFRNCAKLCHPDIVVDDLKDKAHEIMQKLNDAYSKKDLKVVKEIFENLKNGTIFKMVSDVIENKDILKSKIIEFRKTIDEILNDIKDIKSDKMFDIISNPDDWDNYFEIAKEQLQKEYEILQEKMQDKGSD